MESTLYEVRPYACLAIGIFAVVSLPGVATVFGAILVGLGSMIWKMRRSYRRALNVSVRR